MIVPLMIWSARSEIDSQPWSSEIPTATITAASTAPIRVGVIPKISVGSVPRIGVRARPATQPVNAAASIVPSIPMLTTPDRSHSTPHSAPRASGVAERRMIGEIGGTIAMR